MALAENRKAYHDYEILEKFEAGLSLRGFEVKSILLGRAALKGGRVIIRNNEAFSVGVHIPPYQKANTPKEYEPDRARKLLLHKKEIQYLLGKEKQKGLTMVPLKLYNKGRKIKLEFAVVRGKKKYDKREVIKKREAKRKVERSLKYI
ncbi:MAG: SsrA-binding protein [Candidatus Ryanbacteria bacterium RIFCSPHIGHO2_02_FULL_45_43]|uniref:SsrA-binding protein n=1 Tax=Candidatus Ryanbacteria bacterium RIFCSPHIGHO2_01_45_13 TaxID=1802112 RepID=A0A1G2FWH3_9BACT|nr:MAG: SsrA-binding protein [Candidatus Ryanbacteria bacterium RIFCSPHIGHO2_01_FULL_44_130]OGZ42425.1 MAG: SsrA-binding protein [Candidatus Ryanbacteria bacterium RIFCSPHIGHO2_01_45_13]OGZ48442.1 MAG: SsrA-binding protein [Candidatus Ryanbacteria bacterium RIFCSPHIGHO2_02_FULL_45_43]OGZ50307.1 MAG: SsrA-binding protein [Candidatus Ryanbacteria bacterium RIFCSPHIGHO2_12_FULL_44_20]OGZ51646.1 MAG: SsrA-binding protein [Candidatus Ryanbacteria bacterium RIFCSPLOWO2_01_FULL_44_230]OGZ54584.1 MAG: